MGGGVGGVPAQTLTRFQEGARREKLGLAFLGFHVSLTTSRGHRSAVPSPLPLCRGGGGAKDHPRMESRRIRVRCLEGSDPSSLHRNAEKKSNILPAGAERISTGAQMKLENWKIYLL